MNLKNPRTPGIKTLLLIGFISILAFNHVYSQTSQERVQYKLLWKITGKNLSAPSYLFGTMHVYDNKAFDFSDSVLLNLLACDAFAMEVHPDSVMNSLIKLIFDHSDQKKNVFKEIFSEKEYQELDSMMRVKSGYSLEKLKSPSMAEFALEKNDKKSKDKSTFLDAYLYGIARSNKKQIIGLEKASDQLSIIDHLSPQEIKKIIISYLQNDSGESKHYSDSYNQLLNIYYSGDIDKIYELMRSTYSFSKEYYDRLITIRNEGMAKNIISSITSRSTFVAVGAAHLPGNEGLIKLLQKEGYDVTKVSSPFSGLANKYKYKSEESSWNSYTFPNGSYAIKMPVAPVPLKMDSIGITLQMSFDLAAGAIYQSTSIALNNFNIKDGKEILDKFEETFKKKGKQRLEKSQKISVEGYDGREFWTEDKEDFFKVRLILRERTLYLLMAGPSKEHANSADAKLFFDSFDALPYPEVSWKECTSASGAFKIDHWGEATYKKVDYNDSESGVYHLNIFSSSNNLSDESYLIRYNDFPPGRVSYNDSVYYGSLINDFYKDLKGESLLIKDKTIHGYKGKEFTFKIGTDGFIKGRVLLRGNRCYFLLTTSTKPESRNIDHFLQSITFLDYEESSFKEYNLKNSDVSLSLPSQPVVDEKEKDLNKYFLSNGIIYNSTDDKTGISYILVHRQLGKYSHFKTSEQLFQTIKKEYFTKDEPLIDSSFYLTNKSISKEYTAAPGATNTYKKIKITLNGKDIFVQMAYLPKDYIKNNFQARFFSSLKIQHEAPPAISSNKNLLFEELASSDTSVSNEAKAALEGLPMTSIDVEEIFEALSRNYDDDVEDGGIKATLLDALSSSNDSKVKPFIKNYIYKIKDNDKLKVKALAVLSSIKTKESTLDFLELIKKEGIPSTDDYHASAILYPFLDSLQLVNNLYPDVLNLLFKTEFQDVLFLLTNRAVEDSLFDKPLLNEIQSKMDGFLLKLKNEDFSFSKSDENYYDKLERYRNLLMLLNNLRFDSSSATVSGKFVRSAHPELAFEAVKILLKNGQSVPHESFTLIAKEPLLRLQLYHYLEDVNQSKLFPKEFLNQKSFAEAALVEYLGEDDGAPDLIELVDVKKILYKGQKKQLYVYKFKYESEDMWYLGISGPFGKPKSLVFDNDLAFSTFQTFDKKKINELLRELLKGTEAELMK
jgi:uncharacterized protein YbaP (TraB family)